MKAIVPDLVASVHGAWTPDGAVAPVPSASVEVRDGAWWLCEGTENLFPDPLNLPSVFSSSQFCTITASEESMGIGNSLLVTIGGLSAPQWNSIYAHPDTYATRERFSIPNGEWVTISQFAKPRLSGMSLKPNSDLRKIGETTHLQNIVGDLFSLPPDAWTRVSVSAIADVAVPVAALNVRYSTEGIEGSGANYLIALPQVEVGKPYATPFTVGTRVDGTLTIPHAQRPGTILVRTRESGLPATTERVTLDGNDAGTFGRFGMVAWDGSAITIATTSDTGTEANMYDLYGVLAYNHMPSQYEIDRVSNIDPWTWDTITRDYSVIIAGRPRLVGSPRIVGR